MEFHEKLQSLAAKEGLKGRKVTRALESFSWNITILKVRHTHPWTSILVGIFISKVTLKLTQFLPTNCLTLTLHPDPHLSPILILIYKTNS